MLLNIWILPIKISIAFSFTFCGLRSDSCSVYESSGFSPLSFYWKGLHESNKWTKSCKNRGQLGSCEFVQHNIFFLLSPIRCSFLNSNIEIYPSFLRKIYRSQIDCKQLIQILPGTSQNNINTLQIKTLPTNRGELWICSI